MKSQKNFWDKNARKYAADKIADEAGYYKTLDATAKYLKKKTTVLEIGGGPGTTALHLSKYSDNILSTDISSEMIKIAKERAAKQNNKKVTFKTATVFDKSFKKNSFDVIIAYNLLHLVDDLAATMQRIQELLKPGGLLISKTVCLKEAWYMIPVIFAVSKVMGVSHLNYFTTKEYQQAHKAVGLKVVQQYTQKGRPPRQFIVAKK